jgi:hypothetical protein
MPTIMTRRLASAASTLSIGRIRQLVLIGMGWTIVALGILIIPLPGPFGLPVAFVGAVILLRNSSDARRLFVRMRRRKPGWFAPFDRFVRGRKRRPPPAA